MYGADTLRSRCRPAHVTGYKQRAGLACVRSTATQAFALTLLRLAAVPILAEQSDQRLQIQSNSYVELFMDVRVSLCITLESRDFCYLEFFPV